MAGDPCRSSSGPWSRKIGKCFFLFLSIFDFQILFCCCQSHTIKQFDKHDLELWVPIPNPLKIINYMTEDRFSIFSYDIMLFRVVLYFLVLCQSNCPRGTESRAISVYKFGMKTVSTRPSRGNHGWRFTARMQVAPDYLDAKNRPLPKSPFGRFAKIVWN